MIAKRGRIDKGHFAGREAAVEDRGRPPRRRLTLLALGAGSEYPAAVVWRAADSGI